MKTLYTYLNSNQGCRDTVDSILKSVQSDNHNAMVGTYDQLAKDLADYYDSTKSDRPFAGVPIAIKDNICVKHELVTCGSRILSGYQSPYTATAVQKLLDAGFIPIGRTNMDEFAMGSSNETSVYGPVKNPVDPTRVPGGSSGGSAAAVAAGLVPAALGSDTGGSIRQPAAFCGVVGLKPTYGRVSRYGLVAFASSLDQMGPITNNVSDAAALFSIISGHDMADATTVNQSVPVMNLKTETSINALKGTRIGVPKALLSDTVVHPDIIQSTRNTLDQLSQEGAEIIELDMQFFDEAVAMYYILAPAEAASNLSRFDGVRYGYRNQAADTMQTMMKTTREHGFGHEVKRRIMLGNYVLSSGYYDAYYGKAQRMRGQLCQHYIDLFESVDVIVSPTTPTTAFKIGANLDPLQMYLADIATIPANLAGVPAVSVPIGTDSQGLPIGVQVTGKWFDEAAALTVAHAIEGLQ
tara:strand:- start:6483 stop:7883 length:1401 start_codon:yes stop_codon:yes gene_type:complete